MADSEKQDNGGAKGGLSRLKLSRESLEGGRFLLGYLRPFRGRFIVAMIALFCSSLAGLAFPGLIGLLIKAPAVTDFGTFTSGAVITLILVALVAQSGFSYIRTYFLTDVAERSLANLRHDLFGKMIRLPISFFHQTRVGEMTSRINTDVGQIQFAITTGLSEIIRQMIFLIGGVALMAYISPRLTLVILLVVPIIVVLAVGFGRMLRKASKRLTDLYAQLNTIAEETFQGITAVKAFTAERRESERFKGKLGEVIGTAVGVGRARGAFAAFILLILFCGIAGMIWYGKSLGIDLGSLTSFGFYAGFVGGAMGSFADLYGSFQSALGASERAREYLLSMSAEDVDATERGRPVSGHVELRGVSFAYASRPDISVLQGITLDVPAGSSMALVGPSGAGKSTLAGILMRFYEPTSGEMIVDGRAAHDYTLHDFRSAIAIVPQDVVLFGGTIAENISYGLPGASSEQIREAARLANAAEFIESFPEGYETVVGERGVQLSGGQRQRVAIARAILKDPSILILDEATSSLDSESERLVQDALDRVMKNRTTFVIAHRLSTIRNADRIAVINRGAVAEQGTYDELLALGGVFARLVALQSRVGGDAIDEGMM